MIMHPVRLTIEAMCIASEFNRITKPVLKYSQVMSDLLILMISILVQATVPNAEPRESRSVQPKAEYVPGKKVIRIP